MGRIISLVKLELLMQSPYPYLLIVAAITFSTIYFPTLQVAREVLHIEVPRTQSLNAEEIRLEIYKSSLILLKDFFDKFRNEIFIPWIAIAISASYGLSISNSLKRERLRFILSFPISKSKYLLLKIVITWTLLYISFYITFYSLLFLRFGSTYIASIYPIAYLREFILISSVSIFIAVLTMNEFVTTFSGIIGWIFSNYIFSTLFTTPDNYSLIYSIEPYQSFGLMDKITEVFKGDEIGIYLGIPPDALDNAVTLTNLYTIYIVVTSLILIILTLIIFERREID